MTPNPRSNTIYKAAILVIVVATVPLAFFFLRWFFIQSSTLGPASSAVATSAPSHAFASPVLGLALKRVGKDVELTVTFANKDINPILGVRMKGLKVDGVAIPDSPDAIAAIPGAGVTKKTFIVHKSFAGKTEVMVDYDITYSLAPSGGGSYGGSTMTKIK